VVFMHYQERYIDTNNLTQLKRPAMLQLCPQALTDIERTYKSNLTL